VKNLRQMLSLSAFQGDLCPYFGPAQVLGKNSVAAVRSPVAYRLAARTHQTMLMGYSSRLLQDGWRRPSAVCCVLVLPLVICGRVSRLRSCSVVDHMGCCFHRWTCRSRQRDNRRPHPRLQTVHMKVVRHGVLRQAGMLNVQAYPTGRLWCICSRRTIRDTGRSTRLSSLQEPLVEVGPAYTVSSMVRRNRFIAQRAYRRRREISHFEQVLVVC
jgi:hypothetical protein